MKIGKKKLKKTKDVTSENVGMKITSTHFIENFGV